MPSRSPMRHPSRSATINGPGPSGRYDRPVRIRKIGRASCRTGRFFVGGTGQAFEYAGREEGAGEVHRIGATGTSSSSGRQGKAKCPNNRSQGDRAGAWDQCSIIKTSGAVTARNDSKRCRRIRRRPRRQRQGKWFGACREQSFRARATRTKSQAPCGRLIMKRPKPEIRAARQADKVWPEIRAGGSAGRCRG